MSAAIATIAAISCHQLTKRYGRVVALDALTLEVPSGEVCGILGPNGAGKTTALRLLTGLARPTSGSATVAGIDVGSGGLALRQRIGVLEQSPQFYNWMRGRELLTFVGELFGMRGAALRTRVDEMLALTGLSDAANRPIGGYSGGMRQRLGLAQALLSRPRVLFLDEPVSALDPAGRHDILRVIAGLRGEATVIMSSHILADIERVCDSVAILDHGKLVIAASVTELQQRYAQPVFTVELQASADEQMTTAETQRIVAVIQRQRWAGEVTADGSVIRVVARDPEVANRELLAVLVAQGVVVERFERGRPTLEDIFLRLTTVGEGGQEQSQKAQVVS